MRFAYVLLGLVTLASVHTSSGQDGNPCDNGLVGFQSEDICCAESCGTCGGTGCGGLDGGAESCCVGTITRGGMLCSETMEAPCIIEIETCSNGLPGIQNGDVCCDGACGQCGGGGCAGAPGGPDNCCTSRIKDTDMMCSDTGAAPCVIENDSMCENGLPGVQNGDICCDASCGTCGGSGCGRRPGGSTSCCSGVISGSGDMCSTTMAAPCIIDAPTPAPTAPPTPMPTPSPTAMPTSAPTVVPTPTPTDAPVTMCSNGLPGFQTGTACCEAQCGGCGGVGCSMLPGGLTNCCTGSIGSSGMLCSVTMEAPCIVDN